MSMRYKIFGRRTGLRVSELALGGGNFGVSEQWRSAITGNQRATLQHRVTVAAN